MRRRLRKLSKSTFFKDSSYMMMSTVITQLIGIATIPLLSRLFTPEAFGIHGSFKSIILILSVVLTLCMEFAIVIPKKEKSRKDIYIVTIANIFILGMFLTLLHTSSILIPDILYVFFREYGLDYFYVVILGSILIAITNVDQSWLVSLKMFKAISISKLILPIFFFLFSILFYFFLNNYEGLIYAQVLAYFALLVYLRFYVKVDYKQISFKRVQKVFKEHKNIPLYTFPNTLLNVVSLNIPFIILGALYGETVVGYYAVGVRLISLPVSFIASSFTQIFYKKSVDICNTQPYELYGFVRKVMFGLLFSGIIIFTLIYFFIPWGVPYFLGDQWSQSVDYLQYLCFWQMLMLANTPVSSLTILLNKQKHMLFFQIFFLVFRCISLWIPFYLELGPEMSVLCYSLIGVAFNIYLFYFSLTIVKNNNKNYIV